MSLLDQPVAVGSRVLRNRLVMTPHIGRLSTSRLVGYIEQRARAGAAMVVVPAGDAVYNLPVYEADLIAALPATDQDSDRLVAGAAAPRERWLALAGAAQRHGALAIGQIHHPGAERSWDNFQPVVAPSAVRADASAAIPHELTPAELDRLVGACVDSAAAIVEAEMDGVELHAGHGYLLNRFLSPYYNRRVDEYGGSPERRLRLLLRIVAEIRARIGEGPLLGVRLPASEEVPGGLLPTDIAELAAELSAHVSYLSVSLGNHDGIRDGSPGTAYTAPWLVGTAPAAEAARTIRAAARCPIVVTGRITTPALARELVESGAADLVGLARALIADPEFVRRALPDEPEAVVPCIGCNECTLTPFTCPVNPAAGREDEIRADPAPRRRRIVVVGAGPAGAFAASRASSRGHDVVLLDQSPAVGGMLLRAAHAGTAAEWRRFADLLDRNVRASGVDFRPGVRATAESVAELGPDVVVVATGSELLPPSLPADRPLVRGADVLAGEASAIHGPVVVVGGREPHLEPLLVAEVLLRSGHEVTLLTEHLHVGPGVEPRTLNRYLATLLRAGMTLRSRTRACAWDGGRLLARDLYAEQEAELDAAGVVVVAERAATSSLADGARAMLGTGAVVHLIGDALAPRRFSHAALEGARAGSAA